jgi:hypothetical protein
MGNGSRIQGITKLLEWFLQQWFTPASSASTAAERDE